jgi:hypothetical protein
MSALGHKQTLEQASEMSACPRERTCAYRPDASCRLKMYNRASGGPGLEALRRKPVVNFLPGFVLGQAVALLDLAFEFLTAAINGR